MRFILMALFLLQSCGQSSNEVIYQGGGTTNPSNPDGKYAFQELVSIESSKTYIPENTTSSIKEFNQSVDLIIPNDLTVIMGNAGSFYSVMIINDEIVCYYKGMSLMTNPLYTNNIEEIIKGQKYLFEKCTQNEINLSYNSGDVISNVNSIKLMIINGDRQSKTKIQGKIYVYR